MATYNDSEVVKQRLAEFESTRSLRGMQDRVYAVNVQNGWFEADRTFGDDIALLHSEVSEAFEEFRKGEAYIKTYYTCKEHGVLHPGDYSSTGKGCYLGRDSNYYCNECVGSGPGRPLTPAKPEGVGSELADILVRLLDTCHRYDINLEEEFNIKLRFNATRGYRHGSKTI